MNAFERSCPRGPVTIKLETRPGEALVSFQIPARVPPELAERIWEMHFTTKKTGTGIGLY